MSSDLLLSLVEIDLDKQPNWECAGQHLMRLTDEQCDDIVVNVNGCDTVDDVLPENTSSRTRLACALQSVNDGWDSKSSLMSFVRGEKTNMVIAACISYGDITDEISDINYFVESGMANAAGFYAAEYPNEGVK